jgi:hypothetical protein
MGGAVASCCAASESLSPLQQQLCCLTLHCCCCRLVYLSACAGSSAGGVAAGPIQPQRGPSRLPVLQQYSWLPVVLQVDHTGTPAAFCVYLPCQAPLLEVLELVPFNSRRALAACQNLGRAPPPPPPSAETTLLLYVALLLLLLFCFCPSAFSGSSAGGVGASPIQPKRGPCCLPKPWQGSWLSVVQQVILTVTPAALRVYLHCQAPLLEVLELVPFIRRGALAACQYLGRAVGCLSCCNSADQ